MTRIEELRDNLGVVRRRIEESCRTVGRSDEVQLIVVTKFFPASDVRLLAKLGVTDVGENRHQEAVAKSAECEELGLRWHFIGAMQSNKAGAIAGWADVVETIDRPKLVSALDRGAQSRSHEVDVLLQVSLDPPSAAHRAGADAGELSALADRVVASESLRLRGLMAVAPLGEDPAAAFTRLADVREQFLQEHPSATVLSAGMSADLEQAIALGATHVRVGSAVLGPRPAVK